MKSLLTFVVGLTIGAGVSWVYHKNKYEEMIKDEIEDLREHYKGKEGKPKEDQEHAKEQVDKMTSEEYDETINRVHSLTRENRYVSTEGECPDDYIKPPYVITPDDFATVSGYDADSFYLHPDDIIINDDNEIVDDLEILFGLTVEEIREQYGIYEEHAVYIRNMRLRCDYEILLDEENYVKRNGD